jgi:hypothetical protein
MRRLVVLLCIMVGVTAGGLAADADAFRFPKTGKHAFHVNLPKGWQSKVDTRGGMLLVPPHPHAVIYIAILVDDKLRNQPDSAVAAEVGKTGGVQHINQQGPAQVSNPAGTAFYKGTAFHGELPASHGLARKAKIVIFHLEPNTWAQVWIVTQPGLNAVESDAIDQVLNGITLTSKE